MSDTIRWTRLKQATEIGRLRARVAELEAELARVKDACMTARSILAGRGENSIEKDIAWAANVLKDAAREAGKEAGE